MSSAADTTHRPLLLDAARAREDGRTPIAALIGADFSARSVTPSNADRGPTHVRRVLERFSGTDLATGIDIGAAHVVLDLGDSRSIDNAWEGAWGEIIEHARAAWERVPFVIALGGDQSITWPMATVAATRGQRLGIVHVDCQRDVDELGRAVTDRNVVRGMVDHGLVRGTDVVQVGLNRFAAPSGSEAAAHERGIVGVTVDDLRRDGVAAAMKSALWSIRECDAVYVSVDIEVLDRTFAAGSTDAFAGGLLPHELDAVVEAACSWPGVVGLEIVEYDPTRDVADITAHHVARVVLVALGALARRAAGVPTLA